VEVSPLKGHGDGDAEACGRFPAADVASRDVPVHSVLLRWGGGAARTDRPLPGDGRALTDIYRRVADDAFLAQQRCAGGKYCVEFGYRIEEMLSDTTVPPEITWSPK